ncbi:MAG: sigma-70 family RNA polymerase sigma factor [Verrucomicrobiota bacterium]|nr:sigma-70 family RNA polymerase sigma factor [Verrucomicrobiota bacterium]
MRGLFLAQISSSDEQVMWRVQMHDDATAFAELSQRWRGRIQALCTRMMGDPHRGEDMAQETFLRLYHKRKDYEPTGKFSTWLWRVAINICHDELRRTKRRNETSIDEQRGEGSSPVEPESLSDNQPDSTMEMAEEANLVRQALMQLPEMYRTVLVLRHYEGLKFREIAEVLGIPEGTVKSRMSEALTQFASCYRQTRSRPPLTVILDQPRSL